MHINSPFRLTQLSAMIISLLTPGLSTAAQVNWANTSGFWDVTSNWSSFPALPGAGDDTVLDVAGAQTITVRSTGSPFTVNSVNTNGGNEILAISSGILNLVGATTANNATGNSTIGNFTQSGGALNGAGNLTVTGNANFTAGTHSGTGTTTLQGTTTISSNGLDLDAGRVLRNEGTVTWSSGNLNLNATGSGGSGRVDNASGAVWDSQSNQQVFATAFGDLNNLAGFPAFNNAGIFRKSGGTGTTTVSTTFNNTGTVDAQLGSISLSGGGTHSGTLRAAGGAELDLAGGTHNLNTGTSFDIAGTLGVTSGIVNANVGAAIAGTTRVANGTLNLAQNWQTANFTQSGGTLNGAGNLTVTGNANFTAGTHSGTGTTTLQGTTTISSNGLDLDAGRVLRNEGTVTWSSGNLNLNATGSGGSGRIDNASGAVWDSQGNQQVFATAFGDLNNLAGFPAFNNAGIFRKSGGTGTTTVSTTFNNTGTVDAQLGSISLSGGGTHSGTLRAAGGAELDLAGGTHNLNTGTSFDIAGTLGVTSGIVNANVGAAIAGTTRVANGTLNLAQNWQTANFTQSGGTLNGAGNLTVTGNANFTAGTHSGTGTTTLQGTTTISSNGLDLDAGRVLRNEGTVTWSSGNLNLNATGSGGSGRIDNASGAVWDSQGNQQVFATAFGDLNNLAGFPAFNNAGIFRKSGGTGTTTVSTTFNNTGTVDAQLGSISLSGGGTHSGTLRAAGGAELDLAGGTHNLNTGTSFDIAGTLGVTSGIVNANVGAAIAGTTRVANGTLNLAQNWQTANFTQSGGTLNGAGNLTVTGNANFTAGTHSGTGTTTLQGTTTISSNGLDLDAGRVLRNEGTVTWSSGNLNLNATGSGGSGRIDNASGAVWDSQGNQQVFATAFGDLNNLAGFPAFNNAGIFRKSGGTSTTTVNTTFNNTGTVDVQLGTVSLSGAATANGFTNQGDIQVAANAVFETNSSSRDFTNQGTLSGNGTFSVAGSGNRLVNSGQIQAGGDNAVGALAIDFGNNSTFRQLAGGVLDFDLASLASFDTISIQGIGSSVALSGTLQINSLGGYDPGQSDSFTLMTFNPGSLTGIFDNVVVAGFDPSIHFDVQYLSNSIVIATSAVPLPGSVWFMLSGMGLLAARRKSATKDA
ncbi:hypothetical protein QZJ86_02605 [Methylomonas montana]|uniref:beta strand repeat-containing protein n=1 Tax=Methylomonas montana TaxID=3058963 RepID=UPI00265B09C3|nr:hypothetical protein [Methylomonas montana]WKJ91035.1 hypothetical protein QZJ86_02605 [Methylomonas montana]